MLLSVALLGSHPSASLKPDSFGPPSDVAAICTQLGALARRYTDEREVSVRNIIVSGHHAYALVLTGPDSFNVVMRKDSQWGSPFSLGADFPKLRSLTDHGVPTDAAVDILYRLQDIYRTPSKERVQAC